MPRVVTSPSPAGRQCNGQGKAAIAVAVCTWNEARADPLSLTDGQPLKLHPFVVSLDQRLMQ